MLRLFQSGGRILTVRGTNLNVIQAPEVSVVLNVKYKQYSEVRSQISVGERCVIR